jgi:RNA polymerase sigma factor (sigma-70 family)
MNSADTPNLGLEAASSFGQSSAPPRQEVRVYHLYSIHWHHFVSTAERALFACARPMAEDLVADVMVDILRGGIIGLPTGDGGAVRFVDGVIRNRARHLNRREGRLDQFEDDHAGVQTSDPWRQATCILLVHDVERALMQLTPREREIVRLHWLLQWTTPEIALELRIAVRTVKELLRRAKHRLVTHLALHAPPQ